MHTAHYYKLNFDVGFDEALEIDVLKWIFRICNKLEDSAQETESPGDVYEFDSSMESYDNDSSDEENAASGFDIWTRMNN